MRLSNATRRLAAHASTLAHLVHARADGAAEAADKAVREIWRHVLGIMRSGFSWPEINREVQRLFSVLSYHIYANIRVKLKTIAYWGYRSAVRNIGLAIPKRELLRAAHDQMHLELLSGYDLQNQESVVSITALIDMLFPPPSEADVNRIVYGSGWQERLAASTRLAQPHTLASIVANGIIQGKSQQEIAKEILPAVQNVRSSARRIARTEAMRVAGQMQMKAHEALGDLVVGYMVRAVHDEHTRPWHLRRDGTVYWKNPKPGQKGMQQMPNPPDEAPDPSERPPGTPATAWNCRCYLVPVLRPEK